MVDAITSYNANKPVNPKKDLTINWNKLTPKEIKEYEEEGQEVPDYIKTWADYMERLNNVPDDITYVTYVNPNADINASQIMRTQDITTKSLLGGLEPSSATQSEVYAQMCKDTYNNVKQVTDQLEQILKQAEKQVDEASSEKDGVCDRIQTLQERANKLKNDKNDPLAPIEIIDINKQIQTTGEAGANTMDTNLIALQNIGSNVSNAYDLIRGAGSLANTAQSISSTQIRMQMVTLTYSKQLKELAKEHKKDLKAGTEQIDRNLDTVEGYKGNISTSIGQFVAPGEGPDNDNSGSLNDSQNADGTTSASTSKSLAKADEKAAETKQKNAKSTAKSKQEKSQTLADQKILTDPNEILKRKQKRGEA